MIAGQPTSVDTLVLAAMLRHPGGVSASFLRHEHRVPPHEYHAAIQNLQRLGCVIDAAGPDSHRLARTGLGVWADYAGYALREAGIPRKVQVFRATSSTQDVARTHARACVLVLADEQTAGRGRLGRAWVAPPGTAVLMSLTHPFDNNHHDTPDRIAVAVSVALARVLERLSGRPRIQIKWPNDIVADERKIAGILVETLTCPGGERVAVIGVGINVDVSAESLKHYPGDVRDRIGSTRMLGSAHDRLHIAVEAAAEIDRQLGARFDALLVDEWRVRNVLHDQPTRFITDGSEVVGTVLDLDALSGLIVRTDRGTVTHLPAATTTIVA